MSFTEIYAFGTDGNAHLAGEVRNAWRGAMSVWKIMEERHLPMYIPDYIKKQEWYHEGVPNEEIARIIAFIPSRLSIVCSAREEPAMEIWRLADDVNIPEDHRIVLYTTFDNCLVRRENIPRVIAAFRSFDGEDDKRKTNLCEQADILQSIYDSGEYIAVGWNQTSVSADTWENVCGYDDETDEPIPYNCKTGTKHFWLFDELAAGGCADG